MGAIFGFTGPPDEKLAGRMDRALRHRGTGAGDLFRTAAGTVCYRGNLKTGEGGNNGSGAFSDGSRTLALSGNLLGAPSPHPTPEDLLKLFLDDGTAFVEKLHGPFVIVILDGETVHLFRDPAGERTVFYSITGGRFLFSVEPKGIMAAPSFSRVIRPGAVAQYLTFSFIPGSATMLEGLQELPAGHHVTWREGKEPRLERFFTFENTRRDGLPDEDYVRLFKEQLGAAVAERIPSGEQAGLFLSGGIDSSVVAVEAARHSSEKLKTFAIHFGEDYPNELEFARSVASRLGTDHEEVHISPRRFLPNLRRMIWHLDEPIGEPITMPNFELSSHASRQVRVIFNGEGGDPLFGGPKNIPMMLHHWYGGIDRENGFRERMYLASYQRAYEELGRLLTPEWLNLFDPEEELEGVVKPFFSPSTTRFLDTLTAVNIRLKGAHLILPKVERMTSAWGLSVQSPLFDDRLIRLSFRMPARLRLHRGVEKIILKKAYHDDLPPEIIRRPKSGMRVPVHFWFQGEMKRFAKKLLHRKNIRRAGIFRPERVKQLLDYDTAEGPGRYGMRLWMLVTFELWRRIVVEGEGV